MFFFFGGGGGAGNVISPVNWGFYYRIHCLAHVSIDSEQNMHLYSVPGKLLCICAWRVLHCEFPCTEHIMWSACPLLRSRWDYFQHLL